MDRRTFLRYAAVGAAAAGRVAGAAAENAVKQAERPDILFVMTDQQRFDTIRALGNGDIYTPNIDRLVRRGVTFTNAYSTCPVCVAARYTIRTGCFEPRTAVWENMAAAPVPGQPVAMEERCGAYLAKTLKGAGYRTFGIGKFHTQPWNEDLGFEVYLQSAEMYSPETRSRDDYAAWIAKEHPYYDFIEGLMGERTEMYYMPQMSPTPAECGVEWWAADRAIECVRQKDERPYFGFVSFVGPHPPLAPPIPFNRMYDPDRMPSPVRGDLTTDHMDEQIPWMNHAIWAEDINDPWARVLKARYYGEITYIDHCLGRILEAVEARGRADNTLICFFTDHGDHLGDHHAWQKESFFEQACHIPFLLSWPARVPADTRRKELVCLADLFGIATTAAGAPDLREGMDVLGMLQGRAAPREHVMGFHGRPGTPECTLMVRRDRWKYIFIANGGREQLFDLEKDPRELANVASANPEVLKQMRDIAVKGCQRPGAESALDGNQLRAFPYQPRERKRIYQFDGSRGVSGFPVKPEDVLQKWEPSGPHAPSACKKGDFVAL